MAESAVSFLVEKLAMYVDNEVKLLKGVRGKIEFIKDEFQSMKAFLKRAESLQEDDPLVKEWVKQVREVAHDTEDIMDEFMLNFARDHGHGFIRYFNKIKSSMQNLKARHHLSSRIDDVKSKVVSIAERRCRYNITEQSAISSAEGTSWNDQREDACLVDEGELVGIDEPREELVRWLVNGEPGLQVLSIFGMGGLGKTTLAKRVFDDQQVKAYFQSLAWVTVSQSYEIKNILRDMIKQLHRENEQPAPQDTGNSMRLKQMLKGFLQQKRYVIVLDDVWSSEALLGIQNVMPNSSLCCRIIITTRIADVATGLFNQLKVYELKFLSPEASWSLFCRKAFYRDPCPPSLEHLSRQILKKCEGLPLAIVTIGGLLFGKNVLEWEMISRSLPAELESNNRMQNFRKILSLSYNDLSSNLKSCFLYLGVFPDDHVIGCNRLIRLWIAEGFVEKRGGMTREEVGQKYLKELINRSLVQIAETKIDGRLESCRVHDLMRECILSKARDENFVLFASEHKVELHERVRRLSIKHTCNDALKQLSLPSLRSLLIFESATSSSSDDQFVPSDCRLLTVLDLGDSPFHKFPQQILVMVHLKYLSLKRTKVRIIPKSIGKLQNLETLDLKHTLVSELPVEITKLKKLQYLFMYSYADFTPSRPFCSITGFPAPQGIGMLASLHKLCYVKAGGHRSKNTMQDLGELYQLRRLGVTDLKKDDAKELCHSLEKMTALQSLEVVTESEYEIIDLDFLSSPPKFLEHLYIKGCLQRLPHWLPLLNNLTRVHLRSSRLESSPLVAFQNMPSLVELELNNAFDGETLVFEDKWFPKLKELSLKDLQNLRFVLMNGQAMPCLESLFIYRCKHFDWQSLLVVIRSLTLLTYLRFQEMPMEFAFAFNPNSSSRMTREGILQECYEEVMERNPKVHFVCWEENHWEWYDVMQ